MHSEAYGIAILASGLSRRFAGGNKLLAPFRGAPLAAHAARTARETPARRRIAVVPADEPELGRLFETFDIDIIANPQPRDGQGRSIAIAIEALADCAAAFVLLGDMPFVRSVHLRTLASALGECDVAIASDGKRRTPPVLFSRKMYPELTALSGDRGAKDLFYGQRKVIETLIAPDSLIDIDNEADLVKFAR